METKLLSTYVFSFAAGRFRVETDRSGDWQMHCYHLEGDTAKVERNIKTIFELHRGALEWMEHYTGIPYPYDKFDFVVIPSFPYSGMEHAGAILYRAGRLFLEENATERERLKRASLISHETAHMWFGDLVTMTWFDDVWLKEAFAQFMADRIVQPAFPDINHRLLFVSSHFDPLHAVERTAGTHPIRQHLGNLDVAGSLYGNIIYHKPPVMLNQLEALMGEKGLREGLRQYLRRFAHGNARWEDLVTILDRLTDQDLETWSRTWVMEAGRPKITVIRPSDAGCASLVVHQDDPGGRGLLWPQYFELSIHHEGEERIVPVFMRGQAACIEGVPVPDGAFILPNSGGHGFGYFMLDTASRVLLETSAPRFDDPLKRAVFAQVLRENFLEGAFVDPARYLAILIREIERETVELNLQMLLDYLVETFWSFLPDTMRGGYAGQIEKLLQEKLSAVETVSMRSACFKAFRSVVTTAEGVAFMKGVWEQETGIEGLPLSERDYCALALELAARAVPDWQDILDAQAGRITDAVLEERFAFVRRAASPNTSERRSFFDGLSEASNRRHEPWVLEAVYYLHHPVRIRDGEVCAMQSLEMLEEIRRTGDIFFPRDWAAATLRYHTSDRVVLNVKRFLVKHPRYPERLRLVVLQAADRLFRANRIRGAYKKASRAQQ
jgi:aminopeptidase N